MKRFVRMALIGLLCTGTLAAARAGSIEVNYDPATRWSDAGETAAEREATLGALASALRAQSDRLPGDQRLRVTMLDVDLAGTVRPDGRGGQPLRVLRGGADWPRVHLQYVLFEGDRELARGDERLTDMNYSWRGSAASEPFSHEKRLLADWFQRRILQGVAASQ